MSERGQMRVDVQQASTADRAIVANLLELYLYDFSPIDGGQIGPDGRFSTSDMIASYWEDPQRHPFVIRANDQLAGFALVKRGSALAGDLAAMDLAEFFILRGYRRSGIGSIAARMLVERWPETWVVRVLANHHEALAFWERVIASYTAGRYMCDTVRQADHTPPRDWRIFRFG